MSVHDIRQEIHKAVDAMPEDLLQSILEYFRELEHLSKDKAKLAHNLKTILKEDKELLHKLAL